jgi:hypothetical protein
MTAESAHTEVLAQLEHEFEALTVQWQDEFLKARGSRLAFRSLVASISEQGRAESDPSIALFYFRCAERLGARLREVDFAAAKAANALSVDTFEPTMKEMAEAIATWRKRLADERNRLAAPPAEPSPPIAPATASELPKRGWLW